MKASLRTLGLLGGVCLCLTGCKALDVVGPLGPALIAPAVVAPRHVPSVPHVRARVPVAPVPNVRAHVPVAPVPRVHAHVPVAPVPHVRAHVPVVNPVLPIRRTLRHAGQTLDVLDGPSGPLYTVKDATGNVLLGAATLNQLRAAHPHWIRQITPRL